MNIRYVYDMLLYVEMKIKKKEKGKDKHLLLLKQKCIKNMQKAYKMRL